tara:strand:- start:292 stop:477 length:186 start_codon:yes stop_codon:yes gene_type:complete
MRMNQATKLVFALEHIAHLEDLIEGNEYEEYLNQSVSTLKYEFERQLNNLPDKVKKAHGWT